ncbi:hypothetical protein FQN49_006559 [Arthroderma sp. PD_2]|nr:hypothetical protein FQN49_006559 [Arthroderma sp. PD_2]
MSMSNPFSTGLTANSSSAEIKAEFIKQLQAESAMVNARSLVEKINSNCFEKCVPSPPGASLTSKDETCIKTCMQKYISFWNTTNRAYVGRISQEAGKNEIVANPAYSASNESGGSF